MARSKVAVISTLPETVRDDYRRLLSILGVARTFARAEETLLVPDLVRTNWFPGRGTTPWQLDGVLGFLQDEHLAPERVKLLVRTGERMQAARALDTHCLGPVFRRYGVELLRAEGEAVLPPAAFGERALLPELWSALRIPERLRGKQLVLLPALRVRPGFGVAAAISTWAQLVLPQAPPLSPAQHAQMLVQLTGLLGDLCAGSLVVADATIFGDGAGPTTNRPSFQNVLLASTDPVALDAVAAHLGGLDLHQVPHLRQCAAAGLGRCELSEIDVLGEDISGKSFAASPVRNLANLAEAPHRSALSRRLARSWTRAGLDRFYETWVWAPLRARPTLRRFERTPWGRLFASYRAQGA